MNPFEQLAPLQSDPMPDLGGGSAVVELADTRPSGEHLRGASRRAELGRERVPEAHVAGSSPARAIKFWPYGD